MASFAAPQTAKATGRKSRAATPVQEISRAQVEARAYEKFLSRGCTHGFDQQDWFDAEDELRAEARDRT